jgi:hypothetical protein
MVSIVPERSVKHSAIALEKGFGPVFEDKKRASEDFEGEQG